VKKFLIREIKDGSVQENFRRLDGFIRTSPFLQGEFKHYEVSFSAPSYPSQVDFVHNLGFVPRDLLESFREGGAVTWLYSQFDREKIYATITAAVTVRFFLGRYEEDKI
jgi:hypothetical protein